MAVARYFVMLALGDELGVGEGPMIARVIEIVMRTNEDIYVSRLHSYLGQLFNHVAPQFYLRNGHVRWGLEVRWQAAVNQNIAAIAGLNEIADSRYFNWTHIQGRNLHEVKPLRPRCASCHPFVLSFHCKRHESR